jgi:hypothetical protein
MTANLGNPSWHSMKAGEDQGNDDAVHRLGTEPGRSSLRQRSPCVTECDLIVRAVERWDEGNLRRLDSFRPVEMAVSARQLLDETGIIPDVNQIQGQGSACLAVEIGRLKTGVESSSR